MAVTFNIVLPVLLFVSVFCFASSKVKRCEKVKIPLCKSVGYKLAHFPNMFNQTQEEAALDVHRFLPLVQVNCSPDLNSFLCFMYAPRCQRNSKDAAPPCRSVCERAREGCEPLMLKFGFSWPERMTCENFPESGGERVCLDSGVRATRKPTPTVSIAPTKMSNEEKCEKIKIPMCQSIGYKLTHFPNMFNHSTQEEAALELHRFWPLVDIKCSPDLRSFLCSMYAPMCQPNFKDAAAPCRSVCERARQGCEPLMLKYGSSWPERMRCENFPESGRDRLCLDRPRPTSISTTKMSSKDNCEKTKIPMCRGYNLKTSMPNMLNHSSQEEAAIAVRRFRPLVNINCSPDLKFFLCSVYAPTCQPNATGHVPPCRSLCRRVKKDCGPLMLVYGISWPKPMGCKNFPKSGGDRLCIEPEKQ